jgi:hypothetical protein
MTEEKKPLYQQIDEIKLIPALGPYVWPLTKLALKGALILGLGWLMLFALQIMAVLFVVGMKGSFFPG